MLLTHPVNGDHGAPRDQFCCAITPIANPRHPRRFNIPVVFLGRCRPGWRMFYLLEESKMITSAPSPRRRIVLLMLFLLLMNTQTLAQTTRVRPSPLKDEPRNPIRLKDLPLRITAAGSYYLTENLDVNEAVAGKGPASQTSAFLYTIDIGITVAADDVTIDLMGFRIRNGSTHAIQADPNWENTAIFNGTVETFTGKAISLGNRARVHDIVATADPSRSSWKMFWREPPTDWLTTLCPHAA